MKQLAFWGSLILASALVALYLTWVETGLSGNLVDAVIPLVLGKAAALLLIPAIPVWCVVLIRKLFRRSTSKPVIFVSTSIIWAVMVFLNIRASSFESTAQQYEAVGLTPEDQEISEEVSSPRFIQVMESSGGNRAVEFSPTSCEFSVSFPSAPSTYTNQVAAAEGSLFPLHGAQLTVARGSGFIRAECASVGAAGLGRQFGPESMTAYMTEIANNMGLSRLAFETTETSLGRTGTVTGVRDSERGRLTVRIVNIIGDSSILTLYLTALSKDFQTPEMQPFLQSVKRR